MHPESPDSSVCNMSLKLPPNHAGVAEDFWRMNTNCLDYPDVIPLDGRGSLIFRFLLDMTITLSVILGNGFIVTAIVCFRHRASNALLRVSHVSNKFVLNLALADLLVGLCALVALTPYYVCGVAETTDQVKELCVLRFALPIFSAMTSISSLGAISVDRYVAVVHSLRYRAFMCQRRAMLILSVPWLSSLLASSSLLYWNHYVDGQSCTDRVVPVAFVVSIGVPSTFVVMIMVAFVHFRIRSEVLASRLRRKSMESGKSVTALFGDERDDVKRSARVLLMVVGCFSVTYTPMCILFMARMLAGMRGDVLDLVFELSFTLANVNSLLNPFIYSWQNVTVRLAIKSLIGSMRSPRSLQLAVIT